MSLKDIYRHISTDLAKNLEIHHQEGDGYYRAGDEAVAYPVSNWGEIGSVHVTELIKEADSSTTCHQIELRVENKTFYRLDVIRGAKADENYQMHQQVAQIPGMSTLLETHFTTDPQGNRVYLSDTWAETKINETTALNLIFNTTFREVASPQPNFPFFELE